MKTVEQRLFSMMKVMDSGCHEWQRYLTTEGYGQITVNKKSCKAHRVAFEIYRGPIPDGLCVCHTCDNRKCVNPDHLFLGTNEDNMMDMIRKGRNKGRGDKVKDSHREQINKRYISGSRWKSGNAKQLASEFGVSKRTITKIAREFRN